MKHQQVSVDYWAMGKTMLIYIFMTGMMWLMLRMFKAVFLLPRRLRAQQDNVHNTLAELQKRFPDLNITEEDLKNAETELDEYIKEQDNKAKTGQTTEKDKILEKLEEENANTVEKPQLEEDKKTI